MLHWAFLCSTDSISYSHWDGHPWDGWRNTLQSCCCLHILSATTRWILPYFVVLNFKWSNLLYSPNSCHLHAACDLVKMCGISPRSLLYWMPHAKKLWFLESALGKLNHKKMINRENGSISNSTKFQKCRLICDSCHFASFGPTFLKPDWWLTDMNQEPCA